MDPRKLADQHLIAEYNEILMLAGYVKKYPEESVIPDSYRLGKGHMLFFKDKLMYLAHRHVQLKKEMRRRGFATNIHFPLEELPVQLHNDWTPSEQDYGIIKERIREKIKQKPEYYRYEGKKVTPSFLLRLLQ